MYGLNSWEWYAHIAACRVHDFAYIFLTSYVQFLFDSLVMFENHTDSDFLVLYDIYLIPYRPSYCGSGGRCLPGMQELRAPRSGCLSWLGGLPVTLCPGSYPCGEEYPSGLRSFLPGPLSTPNYIPVNRLRQKGHWSIQIKGNFWNNVLSTVDLVDGRFIVTLGQFHETIFAIKDIPGADCVRAGRIMAVSIMNYIYSPPRTNIEAP